MANASLEVVELVSRESIATSFELMKQLRDRIAKEHYVDEVEHQRSQGYRLFAGSAGGRLVTLAGVRHTHTLSRGEHVFVDDLIVADGLRGTGIGRAMLEWLAQWTQNLPCPLIYFDSRDTAKGFYAQLGFKFLTSIPCFITPERLLKSAP